MQISRGINNLDKSANFDNINARYVEFSSFDRGCRIVNTMVLTNFMEIREGCDFVLETETFDRVY